jgi:ADP-ribosylglycohydrolase
MNFLPFLAGWEPGKGIVEKEVVQLAEEGRDPQWIKNLIGSVDLEQADDAALAEIWSRLQDAPARPDFAFAEPSGLAEIRVERAPATRQFSVSLTEKELSNRMFGAWLGRCCGCALGKPVEAFMDPLNGLSSKERIKTYLMGVAPDEYPLRNYFPGSSSAQEKIGALWCPASQRENIAFMETDDDIRYTVLGQKILLEKGAAFTSLDVMNAWIGELPYTLVCTAETQAYRNYVLRYRIHHMGPQLEVDWTWVATHQNPYREWIGAQIRADSWGYAAPGNPELAAEFAWRDARISHVKNGIYGEMFVAAMIAAGFALDDPLKVIQAGLAEIPRRSRLHAEMEQVIEICRRHRFSHAAFEQVFDEIYALLGHYHPVHTNNNAALVVAALLLGQRDFEQVITLAVMGGWDTDCNGATAASIFGAMHGAESIPAKWKDPLHDTLYSRIFDYHPISISECARRSVDIALKISSAPQG